MWSLLTLAMLAPGAVDDAALASAAEMAVVEDARDGFLEQSELLEAALSLSGVNDPAVREVCSARLAEIESAAGIDRVEDLPREQAVRRLIDELHSRLLVGEFDAHCSSLEKAFSEGKYNCVTSLILALDACRRHGIEARAMQQDHHVWLRVGSSATGDMETTKLLLGDAIRSQGQPISDGQLLSRLLYNQARQQHGRREFAEAARRLEWCLRIDPEFAPAERNLRIVLGNWIATALAAEQFSEASAVCRRAISRFPEEESFARSAETVRNAWTVWREGKNRKQDVGAVP